MRQTSVSDRLNHVRASFENEARNISKGLAILSSLERAPD
jgi:hypothetical protein